MSSSLIRSICLREVVLAPGSSASIYERCPFTGGHKYKHLMMKSWGPQFVVHLWEVSISEGSTVDKITIVLTIALSQTQHNLILCQM